MVNSSGEFLLSKLVVQQAQQLYGPGAEMARKAFVGEFYAHFFGWVNLLGLVLQTLSVSRIFRYIGVRGSLFILPSIALTGYSMILIYPALYAVRTLKDPGKQHGLFSSEYRAPGSISAHQPRGKIQS